jgi:DNA-binding XRE family transcriptional regulator
MKKTVKRKPTTDAIEIIDRRYDEGRRQRIAELAEAEANDTVARKIYELRKQAGLTQQQLAKLVGTTTSVISRLEDADYEGSFAGDAEANRDGAEQTRRTPFRRRRRKDERRTVNCRMR